MNTDFADLLDMVLTLQRDLEDHKVATRNMVRVGPVVERDKDKGVRLQTDAEGEGGGKPHQTPWGQPAERSGVERDVPRMGALAAMLAPYGDPEQGVVLNYGHTDAAANPATHVDETVIFNRGKIRLSVSSDGKSLIFANDKVKQVWEGAKTSITVDGKTTTFEADKITFPDGAKVSHGEKNIGKDHIHGGVQTGSAKTAAPEA